MGVSILTFGLACGPPEDPTEPIQLVERSAAEGEWLMDSSPAGEPWRVTLVAEASLLKITRDDGVVVGRTPITHVDLVVCYAGCSRSCRVVDDSTRPWSERKFLEVLGPIPDLRRAATSSAAGDALPIFHLEVCARGEP